MAIFDFLHRRKIKAIYYFTETDKQFDLPGIKVQISKLSGVDVSTQVGGGKSHKKITIPENADITKLAQLDMMQYQLATTINTLKGNNKQEKTEEYVNVLLQMFKLVSGDISDEVKKKPINNDTAQTIDFRKLNKYLTDRDFKSTRLPNDLSTSDGYVIWPITLQPSTTYIHTAQIQLIKLLISAGWKLHVIIGDCGKYSATVKDTSAFKQSIISLLEKNSISITDNTVTFLSKYFKRDASKEDNTLLQNIDSLELLTTFHNVSESVEWFNYWEYITKNYNKTKKEELKKRKILNNLQPLLNWVLVITITQKYLKSIVIAGEDEQGQWDNIVKLHGSDRIGMIYIQELKDGVKTMSQTEIGINNEKEMLDKIKNGNMAQWLYNHFVELPHFLKSTNEKPSFCKLSDNECSQHNDNCIRCLFENNNKNFNDNNFDKSAFVSEIYQIANPANAIS